MNTITEGAVSVLLAVIGVAILAVLVSQKSNTPQVLSSFGQAFSAILGTAVSPVTGTGVTGSAFNMGTSPFPNNVGLVGGWPSFNS